MAKKTFIEALKDSVLLASGAMGTELYSRGVFINKSFEETNITNPLLVKAILDEYAAAGACVLKANTFGANRAKLRLYGLESRMEEINRAGISLARQASGEDSYVLASMGPATGAGRGLNTEWTDEEEELSDIFAEQARMLHDADAILLETFQQIDEMCAALRSVRAALPDMPIIAQMAYHFHEAEIAAGRDSGAAAARLCDAGASVVGVNCGPPHALLPIIESLKKNTSCILSAMPNAGLPEVFDGRTLYLATAEYMAESARRYAEKGVRLIGGCCGTNPGHIKEMARFLRPLMPRRRVHFPGAAAAGDAPLLNPAPLEKRSPFGAKLGREFLVSVELDPPHGLDPSKTLEGAKYLASNGIDAVNIADGPRAIARMGPAALAQLVRQVCDIETIVHVCCRDRNLLALQMDLIGYHALGLHNLLIVTGDPPKMGNYPDATPIFDLDSIGLLHFANAMNHGRDLSGRSLREPTAFVLGCGCNPAADDILREAKRYEMKVEAGAEFVFSQPVYDPEALERFLALTAHVRHIPFFVGIAPLASYKNAEFLNENIPGMKVPDEVLKRLKSAGGNEHQRVEGIRIAHESLASARRMERIQGTYIFPPFNNYKSALQVLEDI
jgi:methionine synthase / methylenetetrahydrofolate reductase(NADPH)